MLVMNKIFTEELNMLLAWCKHILFVNIKHALIVVKRGNEYDENKIFFMI